MLESSSILGPIGHAQQVFSIGTELHDAHLPSRVATRAEQAPKKQIVITTPKPGKLKIEVAGHFGHDVVNAAGQKFDELSSVNRVVEVPPGIYSVKFGNGTGTGIEVKAGETTEIKPDYLEVDPIGNDFAYVLEPETGEVVEEIHGAKPRATLMPGRFDVKMSNTLWPGGPELKPGEVTTLKPGVLAINVARCARPHARGAAARQVYPFYRPR